MIDTVSDPSYPNVGVNWRAEPPCTGPEATGDLSPWGKIAGVDAAKSKFWKVAALGWIAGY